VVDQGVRAERAFLALCLALPGPGATALQEADPDQVLTSAILRRAAKHLAHHLESPLAELPPDDDELARVIGDLVALAGRGGDPSVARLQHARLVLERSR